MELEPRIIIDTGPLWSLSMAIFCEKWRLNVNNKDFISRSIINKFIEYLSGFAQVIVTPGVIAEVQGRLRRDTDDKIKNQAKYKKEEFKTNFWSDFLSLLNKFRWQEDYVNLKSYKDDKWKIFEPVDWCLFEIAKKLHSERKPAIILTIDSKLHELCKSFHLKALLLEDVLKKIN